jgi:hypothetical protein
VEDHACSFDGLTQAGRIHEVAWEDLDPLGGIGLVRGSEGGAAPAAHEPNGFSLGEQGARDGLAKGSGSKDDVNRRHGVILSGGD